MARKKTAIAKDPNHAVDAVRCLLPCQVRRGHPDVVNAYTDCYHSLQMEGLIPPTYRPLSARNLMGFLYRLCGNQLRNQSPWTLTALLDRYQTLGIHCRTTLTLRAHAHWITTLLQCPGFAQGPPPPVVDGCGYWHRIPGQPQCIDRLHGGTTASPASIPTHSGDPNHPHLATACLSCG